ncbi:MAG TPA: DUF2062 domain-containing protein [Gammaproteobacteria bacterium]|nr:DUF2062 domain-containing protein [Gammaproteobacteria bacterium]
MPKKFIKRFLPADETLKNHKSLGIFGRLILAPNLWHLNKRSVSRAFAVGLFCAFIPVPFQMVLAAAGALMARANLPISVALVWITNPVTMPPIFYAAYLVGSWVLNTPPMEIEFSLTIEWLETGFQSIWQPFLLGCLISGIISAVAGLLSIRAIWRYLVLKSWQKRKLKRNNGTP